MENENRWEYDYSNLYRGGGQPAQPAQEQRQPQQPQQPQQPVGGYTNVGSSGTNTANQYERPGVQFAAGAAQPGYTAPGGYPYGAPAGGAGGAVPPKYTPGNDQDEEEPKGKRSRKKGGHSLAARVVTVALAGVVGFGGGVLGSYLTGGEGNKVVVQSVQRDTSAAAATTTSTGGSDLSLSEVSALVSPSVVVIITEQMVTTGGWYGTSQVQSGAGSGVIMSADGYILTCAHVVDGAANILVTVGEQEYTATVVGEDSESDIAVLKIDASGLTPAVMGDSDTLAVGEEVVAVGNPLGELGGTVTNGIISALNRDVVVEDQEMTLIQTNASVSPGNSGGGLFNMAGELVGIVNAKSNDSDAEGLGFAIPINTAFAVAQDLIETGYVTGRPAIGVTIVDIDTETELAQYSVNTYGVYIYSVESGSPAAQAGLQAGDRVISADDTEISQSSDLTGVIAEHQVGDTITLTVAREGKTLSIPVTLAEKNSGAQQSTDTQQDAQQGTQPGTGTLPGFGR